jgi:hypothetical protein
VKPWTPFERSLTWRPPPPLREGDGSMLFLNSLYSVIVVPLLPTAWTWLEIIPRDGLPVRRWRDLQRVKNEIMGPQREAVEIFPGENRLHGLEVNAFDLWVAPEGQRFPFGWTARLADQVDASCLQELVTNDRAGIRDEATCLRGGQAAT